MELFKHNIDFKTYELLESMVELSKIRSLHAHNEIPDVYITSFNLGRGAGHTQSVIEYITKHPNEKFFIIVGNSYQRKLYWDKIFSLNSKSDVCIFTKNDIYGIKGIRLEDYIVFIDVFSFHDSSHFAQELYSTLLKAKCKALVRVGGRVL